MLSRSGKMALRHKLAELISPYGIFQYNECADRVQRFLENSGKHYGVKEARRVTIETGRTDRLYGRILYNDTLISTNGFHTAIGVDGIVYDNVNPEGIEWQAWQAQLVRVLPPEDISEYGLSESLMGIVEGGYATFIVKTIRIVLH